MRDEWINNEHLWQDWINTVVELFPESFTPLEVETYLLEAWCTFTLGKDATSTCFSIDQNGRWTRSASSFFFKSAADLVCAKMVYEELRETRMRARA